MFHTTTLHWIWNSSLFHSTQHFTWIWKSLFHSFGDLCLIANFGLCSLMSDIIMIVCICCSRLISKLITTKIISSTVKIPKEKKKTILEHGVCAFFLSVTYLPLISPKNKNFNSISEPKHNSQFFLNNEQLDED